MKKLTARHRLPTPFLETAFSAQEPIGCHVCQVQRVGNLWTHGHVEEHSEGVAASVLAGRAGAVCTSPTPEVCIFGDKHPPRTHAYRYGLDGRGPLGHPAEDRRLGGVVGRPVASWAAGDVVETFLERLLTSVHGHRR